MDQLWCLANLDLKQRFHRQGNHPLCREELAVLLAKPDAPTDQILESCAEEGERYLQWVLLSLLETRTLILCQIHN